MTEPIRLAKRVAELRACSRREAELLIVGGWVRVAGVVVEEPQHRVTDEAIEIDAGANAGESEPVTFVVHKPADAVAEPPLPAAQWAEDPGGRRSLKMHFTHLTPCVPLEVTASGLVVFTQDWKVARKLTEDLAGVEQEFVVEVAGDLPESGLKRLNQGIAYQGKTPLAIKVSWQNESRLRIALKGARPGQIAHMCQSVGLQVIAQRRIRLGAVPLGKIPAGQWRYLRDGERF